jgi:hypothetical protein
MDFGFKGNVSLNALVFPRMIFSDLNSLSLKFTGDFLVNHINKKVIFTSGIHPGDLNAN